VLNLADSNKFFVYSGGELILTMSNILAADCIAGFEYSRECKRFAGFVCSEIIAGFLR